MEQEFNSKRRLFETVIYRLKSYFRYNEVVLNLHKCWFKLHTFGMNFRAMRVSPVSVQDSANLKLRGSLAGDQSHWTRDLALAPASFPHNPG